MLRLEVRIAVEAKDKTAYSAETIVDRRISTLVPPGRDPMQYLKEILDNEGEVVSDTVEQFPVYLALASPSSQE